MLIITAIPAAHCGPSVEDQNNAGKNRFECRTCPYQMVLDRRYFERKNMDLKKVDDILGGADSWQNVDQTDGESEDHQDGCGLTKTVFFANLWGFISEMCERRLRQPQGILPSSTDSKRRRAHDELLQVRQMHTGMA